MTRTRPAAGTTRPWRNWTGDEGCTPQRFSRPASVANVASAVADATRAGRTVRVVGAGHSFGDLVCTNGLLLNLDRISGIHHIDADAGLVTVGAGTRLADLTADLANHGLALPNLGDIDRQSIAGAVSTATHGTGRALGNLATQIAGLEMVLADGNILSVTDDDPDTLRAARVSLGALGVITAYSLRVVPAFTLHAQQRRMPLTQVLDGLDDLVDGNDHFEFFHFPHTDTALVKLNNRTTQPLRPPSALAAGIDAFAENRVLDVLCRIGRRFPRRIPAINRTVTRLISASDVVDHSRHVFASPRSIRFTEMEWAIPRGACADLIGDIRRLIDRDRIDVGFPIEVRFVAADTASYLSPSYDRETAYVAVHMYRGMPWERYFRAVQDAALTYGGRPHWGKRHFLCAEQLADRYPEWQSFQAVRARLDPGGTFSNDHVRRVLGDGGHQR